ncbi:MAG: nitrite/sulfite reductase [Epsilonproteobacteria bacterium]|nr:hypothetical protein [Campylobacterota bacterium]NPA56212.1 nitrite/sulfite reductase [Campylobacterota bacterium]
MKLNKIERWKLDLKPIDYYSRLEELTEDPRKLEERDRFYLKNFGIYSTKLRPESFMIRLRLPGGRISLQNFTFLQEIVEEFRLETLLTARADIELHNLELSQALSLHRMLRERGIETFATLTDNVRNIVTDPFDGFREGIEVYPLIKEIDRMALDPELLGMLPRKFNTAIVGVSYPKVPLFGQDLLFALAEREGRIGFNIYLGGKNSHFAQDANIFATPEEVPPLFKALLSAYLHHGPRSSRTKARLFHLLEEVGIERFRGYVEEYFGSPLTPRGRVLIQRYREPHGVPHRREGRWGVIELKAVDLHGIEEVRVGVDQQLYLFGKTTPSAGDGDHMTVCAGSRYCLFSLFDTKEEIERFPLHLFRRHNLRIGLSGCLKGCGRHIGADIGFVGIRTNLFGKVERGVRLYLGGLYTRGELPARLIYWAVPLRRLAPLVNTIIEDFRASGEREFEEYSRNHLNRFSTPFLAYFFLGKTLLKSPISLSQLEEERDPFGLAEDPLEKTISSLEHRLFGS